MIAIQYICVVPIAVAALPGKVGSLRKRHFQSFINNTTVIDCTYTRGNIDSSTI